MRTIFLTVFFIFTGFVWGQGIFLVKDGQTDYTIVIPNQAIPSEVTAAKELQAHFRKMAGADLKIVKESEYQAGPMIAVGFNDKLPASLRAGKYGVIAEEELIIDRDGRTVLLAGGRPRGTLYAVYEYLDQLGVRWYTPEYTKIPNLKAIPLPEKTFRYTPPLVLRSYLQNNRPTPAWTARNRMNQYIVWGDPGVAYGGGYSQGPDMHTFWHIVTGKDLDAHPEWIAEWGGKREKPDPRGAGLCLSNKGVRKFLIDKTLDYARKNPQIKLIWIGQNDSIFYCTCPKCKKFYADHGGKPSALNVQLVNELADAMKKEMPDRMVKTLAYWWSQDPPTGMKVRDNVIVMFCAWSDYYKPIATDPSDKCRDIRKRAAGWKQIAKNLEVYLYQFPVDNYWYPSPNLYVTGADIEWAYKMKIPNVYMSLCGCNTGNGSELVDLRAWVYARLLWNPRLDILKLIDEFVHDYYGPAADTVLTAIQMTQSNLFDKQGKMIEYNKSVVARNFLNPVMIRQVNQMIEKAQDSLKDEVYKKRLRYVWLPYLYSDVQLGFTRPGNYDSKKGTWSFPMEDGALRIRYGQLAIEIMKEEKISAMGDSIRLSPEQLTMEHLFGKKE